MGDFFISHASEDKDLIARPLALELRDRGYEVWYDEFSLTLGDSLRESIDHGLATSQYGIVILSPDFMRKNWTREELDGLMARQTATGEKRILPVWHHISRDDLLAFSPMLAGKMGVSTESGFKNVVEKIVEVIGGNKADGYTSNIFQDVIDQCAGRNLRKRVHCTLELTLNSFAGYDATELFPLYKELALKRKFHDGYQKVTHYLPSILQMSILAGENSITFTSGDRMPSISNHYVYDKLVIAGNRIKYSYIEISNFNSLVLNTDTLLMDILALLLMVDAVHHSERKTPNIDFDLYFDTTEKTLFSGSTEFEVDRSLGRYCLPSGISDIHLRLEDLGNRALHRIVNRIHTLFKADNPNSNVPYLSVNRDGFDEKVRELRTIAN